MLNILGQVSEGSMIAIGSGLLGSGLATGLLISLVKHANNGDIHINRRDNLMIGDKKDYVRKETCEQKHIGDNALADEIKKVGDDRHKELKGEIRTIRKGLAVLLSLQTGKPLPAKAGAGNQTEIFEAIVDGLNKEET